MRISLISLILVLLTGCSSLRGSLSTGAIIGGSLGAMSGMVFSPNKESRNGNALIFGALGAGAGALLANYLYTSDPENRDLKQMMIPDDPLKKKSEEVPLFDFTPELQNIKPELSFKPVKKYEVPIEKLPDELKGKVKKQYLLEYETEAKTIQYQGKTIEISPFKAYEHVYEE
ncbi:hypothetical protein C0V70_05780 [Bacteriovorax stolpii]|uniref:Uncharacterized protein n=1 Tax=Bacteriovorax stolpii TaxID=960 RepID=A0A2K9NQ43_BACTC|nr:hypothetical protein [Bacteriovorax stolpii]AUN97631.1 hypothetical protein C0V70_05780 [Bacteriovorax stolpii]TDP52812.1 hypothetical protein C8D79_2579 [Bacteriovorax stolpii]